MDASTLRESQKELVVDAESDAGRIEADSQPLEALQGHHCHCRIHAAQSDPRSGREIALSFKI